MSLFFHGDLCLEAIEPTSISGEVIPPSADGAVVLSEGEMTGHRHAIHGGGVTMFRDDALARDIPDRLYICHLVIECDRTELEHEEHDTIVLPKGTYRVRRQREFDDAPREKGASERAGEWRGRFVCD